MVLADSAADPHDVDANQDMDPPCHHIIYPDPTFHFYADPDPTFHFGADPDRAPYQRDANLRALAYRPSTAPL